MFKLRVMTLNLGGGVKNFTGSPETTAGKTEAISQLIGQVNPDVLCVQEIAHYIDADGIKHSMVSAIQQDGNFGHVFYGETLSMKKHMQVKKDLMVNGIFNDWWDWSKGNAIFSRIPFSRLGDTSKIGVPRNIPIFQPMTYEGSRDTDPRYVILTRLKQAPYPYLLNLHLTTLVGERGESAWSEVVDAARLTRAQQINQIVGLIESHILLNGEPVLLMGDFNAAPEEYTLKTLLEEERGFVRLVPRNPIATHGSAGSLDHIFFWPGERLLDYTCDVIDSKLAHRVSDHLAVVADLQIE